MLYFSYGDGDTSYEDNNGQMWNDRVRVEAEEKGYKKPAVVVTAAAASIVAATRTATWQHFWQAVVIRFGLRESIAGSLALVDGPLPFGDFLTIGITAFTAIEIIVKYNELWEDAEAIARG